MWPKKCTATFAYACFFLPANKYLISLYYWFKKGTFSLLLLIEELDSNEIGYISSSELTDVYYSTLDVPDTAQLMSLSLAAFGLVQETITTITAGTDAVNALLHTALN